MTAIIDPREIFISAEQTRKAVIRLEIASRPDDGMNLDQFRRKMETSSPTRVLAALACELHLKCLIAVQNGTNPPRGHNLLQLFDDLSAENQEAVETIWRSAPPRSLAMRQAVSDFTSVPASLRNDLDVSKDAFIKYRYEFEGNSPKGFIAGDVTESVRFRTLDLRPDFIPFALGPDRPDPQATVMPVF